MILLYPNVFNEIITYHYLIHYLETVIDLLINDKRFNQYESNICYALIISNDEIFEKLISIDFIVVNHFFQLSKRNRKIIPYMDNKSYIYIS